MNITDLFSHLENLGVQLWVDGEKLRFKAPAGVYPNSFEIRPYFLSAKEFGLDLKPYDFYGLISQFAGKNINKLFYAVIDKNYQDPNMKLSAKWIKKLGFYIGQQLAFLPKAESQIAWLQVNDLLFHKKDRYVGLSSETSRDYGYL